MSRAAEFDADFSALFLQEFPRLARTVRHIVGDRARAEELAQDAFIELIKHWRTVVDYGRPYLWLRRVHGRRLGTSRTGRPTSQWWPGTGAPSGCGGVSR